MKMEIIGKRYGTFTDKQGKPVVFRTLYIKSPLKPVNGTQSVGYTAEKIGVTRCLTDDDMCILNVGDTIDVTFNQYGTAVGVGLC